jgi:hypothetical protein
MSTTTTTDFLTTASARFEADRLSTDPAFIAKMSSDWSRMSPILAEKLPSGRYTADYVFTPHTQQELADFLVLAYEFEVPVVPRGAGTGNYGQATPFTGGVVLNLRELNNIISISEAGVVVEAGVKITDLDVAVREAGFDLWMYPSTKGSTIGGFIAGGSAGTGTIETGTTADGWVSEVVVAPCDGSGELITISGDDTLGYIHTYGTTGIITQLTLKLAPRREWVAIYAEFADYAQGLKAHRALLGMETPVRLASYDEPGLVPTLPASVALNPENSSMRIIAERDSHSLVLDLLEGHGGSVVAVFDDYKETDKLSSQSYNHAIYYRQQAGFPCFHVEVMGAVFWDEPEKVRTVWPGALVHLELGGKAPLGMYAADYHDEQQVLEGIAALEAMGAGIHSPHQWAVDRHVERAVSLAPIRDPKGLLNQCKLGHDGLTLPPYADSEPESASILADKK